MTPVEFRTAVRERVEQLANLIRNQLENRTHITTMGMRLYRRVRPTGFGGTIKTKGFSFDQTIDHATDLVMTTGNGVARQLASMHRGSFSENLDAELLGDTPSSERIIGGMAARFAVDIPNPVGDFLTLNDLLRYAVLRHLNARIAEMEASAEDAS